MSKSDVLLRQQGLILRSQALRAAIGEDVTALARPVRQVMAIRDAFTWGARHPRVALAVLSAAAASSRVRTTLEAALRLWWSTKT